MSVCEQRLATLRSSGLDRRRSTSAVCRLSRSACLLLSRPSLLTGSQWLQSPTPRFRTRSLKNRSKSPRHAFLDSIVLGLLRVFFSSWFCYNRCASNIRYPVAFCVSSHCRIELGLTINVARVREMPQCHMSAPPKASSLQAERGAFALILILTGRSTDSSARLSPSTDAIDGAGALFHSLEGPWIQPRQRPRLSRLSQTTLTKSVPDVVGPAHFAYSESAAIPTRVLDRGASDWPCGAQPRTGTVPADS